MVQKTEQTKKAEKILKQDTSKPTYYHAVGRRKEATAQVRLYILAGDSSVEVNGQTYEKGQIIVNGREIQVYFPGEVFKKLYLEPFRTTNTLDRFITSIKVTGGGLAGQLDAVIHGIARALEKIDKEKNRPILKKKGFLTRDPRAKERRKAGFAQKARKKKQSPKR